MLYVAAGSNLYFVYSVLNDASNTSYKRASNRRFITEKLIVNDSGRGVGT